MLSLNAVNHEVSRILFVPDPRGRTPKASSAAKFENTGKTLDIELPLTLARGQEARIQIDYRVRNPQAGLYFFQPTRAEPDVPSPLP